MGVACKPNPIPIYKDFGLFPAVQVFICELLKFFDTPILQPVNDFSRVTSNRDVSH